MTHRKHSLKSVATPARVLPVYLAIALVGLPGCATTTGLGEVVNVGCDLAMLADGVLLPTSPFPLNPCKASALGIIVVDGALTQLTK